MKKNEWQSFLLTVSLIGVLGLVSILMFKSVTSYYLGPMYKVDCYIQCLNNRQYDKIPKLLSEKSIIGFDSYEAISAYYNKTYNSKNKLISVAKIGREGSNYILEYVYTDKKVKVPLEMTRQGRSWYVEFPFHAVNTAIFAPYGSEVYIDSKALDYNSQNGCYELNNVLPGQYLLKVSFEREDYKDYYKMIQIPEEKNYIIPYDTALVHIECPSKLKVSLGKFGREALNNRVEFMDILCDNYKLHIEDKFGYFKPRDMEVSLKTGMNQIKVEKFELSEKGEDKLSEYVEAFYNDYIMAISHHNSESIVNYFDGKYKEELLQVFDDWYIDRKDISSVSMKLKIGKHYIDDNGFLHILLRETTELTNEEEDEINGVNIERKYRVLLDFETVIYIMQEDWKVIDRSILQSIVAVKDQEGRWVQY